MRLTSSDLSTTTQNRRATSGEIPLETEAGQIVQVPDGQTAPTAPGRRPIRSAPAQRSPMSYVEPLIDVACSLFAPNPGGFIDTYLDFSEYTNSRSVADGLMRTICGDPPGSPQPSGTPLLTPVAPSPNQTIGGQCDGVRYRVDLTVVSTQSNVSGVSQGFYYGPISAPSAPVQNQPGTPRQWTSSFSARDSATGPITVHGLGNYLTAEDDDPPPTFTINAVDIDGAGNNCGDAQPSIPTDTGTPTPPRLPPATIDPGDGGPPITIAPEISIGIGGGGPSLRFDLPDVTINVDVGGVDINFPGVPGNDCPPDSSAPPPETESPAPGDGDPDPPPPDVPDQPGPDEEPEVAFVAVIVTAGGIVTPSTALPAGNGTPTIYAPRLGSLQFKIRAGGGLTGWTTDIDIKNGQQYIAVPGNLGAVDVRITSYGSTSFRVKRLYRPVDSTIGAGDP